MAAQLLKLADAVDGKFLEDSLGPALAQRNEHLLTGWAEAEFKARQKRKDFLPRDLLGEPAWDMLLDLFIQHARNDRVSVTSACHASGVAESTALRWLTTLERRRLTRRVPAIHDKRVQFVELTESGRLAMSNWLRFRATLPN